MAGPEFNPFSALNMASGAFRAILFEAEKVKTAEKLASSSPSFQGTQEVGAQPPPPGVDDPLKMSKIEVKVTSETSIEKMLENPNVERGMKLVKALGFKDLGDFMDQIVRQMDRDGVNVKERVPIFNIALALLSTDAVRALEKPPSTQGESFNDFILVEKNETTEKNEDIAVTMGSVHVLKSNADGQKLVEVGAALARLVNAGRLDEDKIYAYANHRTCDVREKEDMVGAAHTCIANLRNRIESTEMLKFARDKVAELREKGKAASLDNLEKANKIEAAISRYLAQLDAIFPRNIVATKHTRGLAWHIGNKLENEKVYLEAQANLLTDWLRETYDKPPDATIFSLAEQGLKNDLWDILELKDASTLPKSSINTGDRQGICKFITEDLRHQVAVLRNEVKYAQVIAEDAEVRHQQELALTQCARNKEGRILPSRYTLDLGVSGGLLFGINTNAAIKVGGGFSYKMTIDVDHAGRITVLSVKGPRGEVGFNAGAGVGTVGLEGHGKLSGGRMKGTELVYDNVDDFLKNSSTDLRIRLNTSGLFHFGWDKKVLARKVDNSTFKAMLKESDYLHEGDKFMTPPKSKLVMDKNEVERKDITGTGRIAGGQIVAKARLDVKVISTHRKHVTYTSRFMGLTKSAQLGKAADLVKFNGQEKMADELRSLQEEMDDFEQAVNHYDWDKSLKLRKYLNRHTASFQPPRKSLEEHLLKRVPGFKPGDKINSDVKARFLASLSATIALLGIQAQGDTHLSKEDQADFAASVQELLDRTHQPQCHVSESARVKHLYTVQKTDLGSVVELEGGASANGNLHLPVVNLLGADLLSGFAPGIKVGFRYQHRPDAEKTGLPHLDNDRLEFFIGTTGSKAERIIMATVVAILNKIGVKEGVKSVAKTAATSTLVSPALSIAANLLSGSIGTQPTEENRFKDGKVNLLGLAKANYSVGGDSGVAVRLQLVKTESGGWKFETIQSINYSELTVEGDISGMVSPGFGFYVGGSAGYGSTSVMGERIFGTSLTPLLRGASEFKLHSMTMQKVACWDAFLAANEKGLHDLAKNIANPNSVANRELEKYKERARKLPGGDTLAERIREEANRFATAATIEARKQAATALFTALSQASEAYLKAYPPVSGGGKLSVNDKQLIDMNEHLDGPLDVQLDEFMEESSDVS